MPAVKPSDAQRSATSGGNPAVKLRPSPPSPSAPTRQAIDFGTEYYGKISLPPPKDDARLRTVRAGELGRALKPEIEEVILDTLKENPKVVIDIVYPIIGRAIRKSIASSLQALVASIERQATGLFGLRKLSWRWEAFRTKTPYAEIVLAHSLIYRIEEVLLIHRETGILVAHASSSPEGTKNRDLVSSMLVAIEDFARDSFELDSEDELRSFSLGDLQVLIKSSPSVLLATAVRGTATPDVNHMLDETLETLHARFRTQLQDFDGDLDQLKGAFPLLTACLTTKTS